MTAPAETRPATGAGIKVAELHRYLGSARVVRLDGASLVVVLEHRAESTVVHATLALAFPYRSVVGDQLLVIGDAHAFFVIGVLDAHGRASLSNARGVSLRAESGCLRLIGDRGLKLTGSRIHFQARRLDRLAVTAVQAFGELRTQVRERLTLEAGEVDELSQRGWLLQAKRVVLKALTGARVKSTAVRLG